MATNEWDQFKRADAAAADDWEQFKKVDVAPAKDAVTGLDPTASAYRLQQLPGAPQAPNVVEQFAGGAKHALDRAAMGVKGLLPESVQRAGDWVDEQMQGRKVLTPELLQQGEQFVNQTGPASTIGQIAGDVALSAAPVARGAQVLTRAAQALRLGRLAPLAGDIAANTGYSAATAPEDRGTAAAFGAGGAAAGRVAGRLFTGAVKPTDEAAELLQRGVRLTPGQAAGPGSLLGNLEQKATSIPLAGYPIATARTRALTDANKTAVEAVASHVNGTIKQGRPPSHAVEELRDVIGSVYDDVLPRMRLPVESAQAAANDIVKETGEHALVSMKQRSTLTNYMRRRVGEDLAGDFDVAPGEYLKQVDTELGSYARQLSKSTSAEEKAAAPMWYDAQRQWRELALKGSAQNPEDYARLSAANAGYRELLAIEKALKSSGGETIKPRVLAKTLAAQGIREGRLSDVSKQMSATLSDTVPDTGTAGRLAAMALLPALGGGVGYLSDPTGGLAGAGLGFALGTRGGAKMLTGTTGPQRVLVKALQARGLTQIEAEEAIKQAASQAGRSISTTGGR